MISRFEMHCKIFLWIPKEFSKSTTEKLIDLIHSQGPQLETIKPIYELTQINPTEQEFLEGLVQLFPQEKELIMS